MARQKQKKSKKRGRGGAGQNRAESDAFLGKNRRRPDVMETASGLQYTVREEGGKTRFVIPPDLAWSNRGAGSKIGPNAALIFDIRLERVIDG